ncbi:hypothetical protein D1B31_18495 [Neobacillus notoginsengisoli]|uniref:Uncharacterized protein n=1 Tax=Neobacillus notoginsengisoli TaxID=1578198 RepID=A0A417YQ21_9BACI|nr:hypothetical protein [Neobacillus notoginsengisoli]RHW36068.1 hypothetical protein D1B31_18495 [Neobacillus notoginsengisoli]
MNVLPILQYLFKFDSWEQKNIRVIDKKTKMVTFTGKARYLDVYTASKKIVDVKEKPDVSEIYVQML